MSMHHVIVGGGPAALNAVETIRLYDRGTSRITLVCDEPAHARMALPYWLSGQISREQTHIADERTFRALGVQAQIGNHARALDLPSQRLLLDDGSHLSYDTLLLATGSTPLSLSLPGADLPGVQPMWSLANTQQLLDTAAQLACPRVALIGAGFVGMIVLSAMAKRGWRLTVIEREAQLLPRMLDRSAATLMRQGLQAAGVNVFTGTSVTAISADRTGCKQLALADGSQVLADLVIVATGVKPNLELAQNAGIATDHGILVNSRLQTSCPDIYAAGDCAQGPVLHSKQRAVHAIQPTAVDHGRIAGANMAGQVVDYPGSLSMNVLEVCGLQAASYGDWDHPAAEAMTICQPAGPVYRRLLWVGDQLVGSVFLGQPRDLGMLTDLGMVKGLVQSRVALGPWKQYLQENPFDIRRAYIASGVAQQLARTTLLDQPSRPRLFRFQDEPVAVRLRAEHALFVQRDAS